MRLKPMTLRYREKRCDFVKQNKQTKNNGNVKKYLAPDMGLEPMTLKLKVWCSTDWDNRAHMYNIAHE